MIRSSRRRTWRVLRSSTCAADTIVIRPAITFDRISIRCRSRSAHRNQSHPQSPRSSNKGRVTFQLCRNRTL
ncbi:hypothetical protein ELH94_32325 [Rhizobium leguminosarum]|nr:hypothetical protein ELH94_32325 [Rhizobium leguminosarum]